MVATDKTPDNVQDALAVYSIGVKLRALRTEKGLTLARLAAETGLSTALLSKLESARMVPTLQTLTKICRVYGTDLAYFFSAVSHHSVAITRRAHIFVERREQPSAKEIPLHRSTSKSRQVTKLLEIPAEASCNIGNPGSRTEITAYILDGSLQMTAAGVVDELRQGDCVVLETDTSILFTAYPDRCRVLAIFARTEDRK